MNRPTVLKTSRVPLKPPQNLWRTSENGFRPFIMLIALEKGTKEVLKVPQRF